MTQAGPAIPIVVVTDRPTDAGPALRVAVVSDGRPTEGGPARPMIEVFDNRPTQGNEPIPIVQASGAQASQILAGPAIPVRVVSGSIYDPSQWPGFLAWYDGASAFGSSTPGAAIGTWAQQAGSAASLTNAVAAQQPTVSPDQQGIIFDGVNDVLAAAFTFNYPQTVFIVAQLLTSTLNKYTLDGATTNNMALNQTNAAGDQRIYSQANGPNVTVGNQPFVISAVYKNGAARIRLNGGTAVTGSTGINNNADGLKLGASGVPNNWAHVLIKAIVLCNGTIDVTSELRAVAYLMARYPDPTLAAALNLVYEGDSRMSIAYTAASKTSAYVRATSVVSTNVATGGETTANIALETAETIGVFNAAKDNIAVYWAGVNDNRGGDQLAANIYNNIRIWIAAVKAANPAQKVILCTEIDSQEALSVANNWSTVRLALNTLIRANAAGADAICDLAADSRLSDATNAIWFNGDKIHLTPNGDAIVALKILREIQRIA